MVSLVSSVLSNAPYVFQLLHERYIADTLADLINQGYVKEL